LDLAVDISLRGLEYGLATDFSHITPSFPSLSPSETNEERAANQAAAATYVIHGDARTVGNRGAGMVVTDRNKKMLCWLQVLLSSFDTYMTAAGVLEDVNINVLEFAQSIFAVIACLDGVSYTCVY
jgi:hypothetical protein